MLVVKLVGGLASQLHKYAVALSISREIGCELKVDCTYFDKERYDFNPIMQYRLPELGLEPLLASTKDISLARGYGFIWGGMYRILYSDFINKYTRSNAKRAFNFIERIISHVIRLRKSYFLVHVSSYNHNWKEELIRAYKGRMYLEGEFGMDFSPFGNIREELRSKILSCHLSGVADEYFNLMEGEKSCVSVHVRRGDYVKNELVNNFHGTCSIDYYRTCISELQEKYPDLIYFIFSDDIEWVKYVFSDFLPELHFFVEGNSAAEDFALMCRCDYHVIANSGFSSFSAWLSMALESNIYSPARWFIDEDTNRNQMAMLPSFWNYR